MSDESDANSSELLKPSELEEKAATIFERSLVYQETIKGLQFDGVLSLEADPILSKPIVGKESVDIASLISMMENSDWVRQGREFYDSESRICPFCQQSTPADLEQRLNDYFDDAFDRDCEAIESVVSNYRKESKIITQYLDSVIVEQPNCLDIVGLRNRSDLLKSKIELNCELLSEKASCPSKQIGLQSVFGILGEITERIESANKAIAEQNAIVANLDNQQMRLKGQIWKFVVESLRLDLDSFRKQEKKVEGVRIHLNEKIDDARKAIQVKELEIRGFESNIKSIDPTINSINGILKSFGFRGFSLAKVDDGKSYKLVRPDGRDAQESLSEGEQSFVTFLYFFHLLRGSNTAEGITDDRVVVFDDPVSSLDSDVLFIVSGLIRSLFEDVRKDVGNIKQIFLLTHNIYFHKEVTYNSKRVNDALKEETFWLVRKPELDSILEKCTGNPIKTSYELLWSEIRRKEKRSNITIQNTIRRILENYFKILGDSF
ncbi:MAG: AAA family ATPase [Acidobacteria bacterium]|nr:AAA family ATPase [Acidobacteriota bacterium]